MTDMPFSAPIPRASLDLRALRALLAVVVVMFLAFGGHAVRAETANASTVELEDMTWIELRDQIHAGKTTAIVPIGGTEQNGPFMALGKHNVRVSVLARRIAAGLGNAIVAPVIAYVPEGGYAPPTSHMKFPGTLTIPDDVFEKMLVSVGQSLKVHGFRDVVFLGDHGGYKKSVQRAVAQLNKAWAGGDARAIVPDAYYQTSSEGFNAMLRAGGHADNEIGTHAALADTALQLAVAPETVRLQQLRADGKGAAPGAAQGVYGGDPRRATAAMGLPGIEAIVSHTVAAIRKETSRQ
jgi:creatinine amidohydrolase